MSPVCHLKSCHLSVNWNHVTCLLTEFMSPVCHLKSCHLSVNWNFVTRQLSVDSSLIISSSITQHFKLGYLLEQLISNELCLTKSSEMKKTFWNFFYYFVTIIGLDYNTNKSLLENYTCNFRKILFLQN